MRSFVVVAALAWSTPAAARVWHVTTADSIQSALSSASAGDLLLLDAGTYNECPVVTKAVHITGAGSALTMLDCAASDSPAGYAVEFKTYTTGYAQLAGLTIRNKGSAGVRVTSVEVHFGDVTFDGLTGTNGAALVSNSGKLLVHDSSFTNNKATYGAAIYLNGGSLSIIGSSFEGNAATRWGGAIYAENNDPILRGNTFTGNSADYGGAAYVTSTSTTRSPVFYENTWDTNSATSDGGAIYLDKSVSATLSWEAFTSNAAGDDGGGLSFAAQASLSDCSFDGNLATGNGGAVQIGTYAYIYRSAFTFNEAASGGAIDLPASSGSTYVYATIQGSTFTSNVATTSGGGLYGPGPYLSLSTADNRYDANEAGDGGALYVISLSDYLSSYTNNTATDDGGAIAGPGSSNLYVYSGSLSGNEANDGGAVAMASASYFYGDGVVMSSNTAAAYGGAINAEAATVSLTNGSAITDNTAENGGGISAVDTGYTGYTVEAQNTLFDGNLANTNGGAIYLKYEQLSGDYAWFTENSADAGGAVWLQNPYGLYLYRSLVCANTATAGPGGGLYIKTGYSGRYVVATAFIENTAYSYGGASYEDGYATNQYSYWYNDTFIANTAGTGYDNHVVTGTARAYLYDSALYGDGDALLTGTGTSATASQHYYYGSLFYNYGTYAYSNDNNWISATYQNYAVDPSFVDYNPSDCWDDDLRIGVTGYSGYYSAGVGVQGTYFVTPAPTADADGDGVTPLEGDCDESNAKRYRGATAVTGNYVDEDCQGAIAQDDDGDGWDGTAYGGQDCSDRKSGVYPGAAETWYDGVDQNCDGRDDYDQDGDGQRAKTYSGTDCDDTTAAVFAGAPEVWYDGVDQDCDGNDADADTDGFAAPADCDDTDPLIYPGAFDAPYDGVDRNCDGFSDNDADHDGVDAKAYGGTDCDDANAGINPSAPEVWYDGVDQNCDGANDCDQDGDGHLPDTKKGSCTVGDDCDDTNPDTYDGAREIVDGKDNDCDGQIEKDADKDGVIDSDEARAGTNPTDPDSDDDGLIDGLEWGSGAEPLDTDGDGLIDALDPDSDDDTIPDANENAGGVAYDTDGDGIPDFRDPDDDGDGIPSATEGGGDLDGDGIPNNRDTDADGDGVPDAYELGDYDEDGIIDALDAGNPAPYAADVPIKYGLGCTTPGGAAAPAGALLLLLGLIRRRRERGRARS